jgi:ubiquitin-like protein Pup
MDSSSANCSITCSSIRGSTPSTSDNFLTPPARGAVGRRLTEGSLTAQKEDNMPQQFEQPQAQQAASQEDDALATTQAAAQTESTDQADVLDDILDDIESALETNAEEYVNSFVQKGGE